MSKPGLGDHQRVDQSVYQRSLINTFVVRYLDSIIPILVSQNFSSLACV